MSEEASLQLRHALAVENWPRVSQLCQHLLLERSDSALCTLLGKALVQQGQDAEAIAAYLQGLQIQPQQPKSHYALAILYTRQQKMALAVCHYQMALQIDPTWQKAAFGLARLFHRLGDSARAFESYEAILAKDPRCAEAHFSLGLLYEQKGDDRMAIRSYRNAIFSQPDYVDAYRYLGSILVRLNANAAAVDVYTQALTRCPADANLYNSLGQLMQAQGDIQLALEAFRQSLVIDPNLAIAHQNLGRLSFTHQSVARAVSHFQRAAALSVKDGPVANNSAASLATLNDYTGALITQGDWDGVIHSFCQVLRLDDGFVEAYCQRTSQLPETDLLFRLQRACGQFIRALQAADRSSQSSASQSSVSLSSASPSFGNSQSSDSLEKEETGQFTGQLTGLLSAQTTAMLKARLAYVYEYLAELSLACDAPARAEQCYRLALSLSPDAWHLYKSLGECLQHQGRQAGAIAIYQAGLLQGQVSDQMPSSISGPISSIEEIDRQQSVLNQTVVSTLFQLEKPLLEQHLVQALSAQNKPAVAVSGVYRRAQDWLIAATGLAARSEFVPVSETTGPDADCGGLTCRECMTNLIRQFSPVQVSQSAFKCGIASPEVDHTLEIFAITLPEGRTWVSPQQNAWSVCNEIAIFSADDFLLADLSRCYPWPLPGCQRHDLANHTVLQRQSPLPPVVTIPGRVAVLSGLSAHVYYHWLFDVLPRFHVLNQALRLEGSDLNTIDFFVVNSVAKPFQRETLQILGIPLEKVVESDRVPHLQADQLVVPNFAGHLDWVPPSSMDFLRRAILGRQSKPSATVEQLGRRLYISRHKAKYRQVFNEDAVIELLSHFGFVSVALETLSVAEQAQLFAQAEAIVGAHGSGLANLVFCSPGTQVIEFFSPYYLRTDYWMISQHLKLHHYYLVGESFAYHPLRQLMYPSGLTEDFSVDIAALRSLLDQAGLIS